MNNPIADLELRKIRLEFDYWMQKAEQGDILCEYDPEYLRKIKKVCTSVVIFRKTPHMENTLKNNQWGSFFDLICLDKGQAILYYGYIMYTSESYEDIASTKRLSYMGSEAFQIHVQGDFKKQICELINAIIHEVKRRVANHLTTSTANLTMTCLDISNGVTELSSTVDNLSQITQTTQDQVDNLVEDRKTMISTVSELKQLVEIVVGETIHLNNTICTMQKQINSLLSNEHHMKEENADLRKSIKTLKQDNADIKQAISELVDYQNTLEKDNAILKCEVNLLKSQSNVYPSYDYGAIRDRMDVYRDELIHIQRIMSRFARRNASVVG